MSYFIFCVYLFCIWIASVGALQSLSDCLRQKEAELRVALAQAIPIAAPPEDLNASTRVETKEQAPVNDSEATALKPPTETHEMVNGVDVNPDTTATSESLILFDQARQDQEEVHDMMKVRVQQLTSELVDVREQLVQLHEQVCEPPPNTLFPLPP